MAFLQQHPSTVGFVCWFGVLGSAWWYARKPTTAPAPREGRARPLYRAFEVIALLTLVPLLLTVIGEKFGGGVTRSWRHFEYVMLLTALGMAGLAAIIYGIWRLLADAMVRRSTRVPNGSDLSNDPEELGPE